MSTTTPTTASFRPPADATPTWGGLVPPLPTSGRVIHYTPCVWGLKVPRTAPRVPRGSSLAGIETFK